MSTHCCQHRRHIPAPSPCPWHPFPLCTAPAESPGWLNRPRDCGAEGDGTGPQGPTGGSASPPAPAHRASFLSHICPALADAAAQARQPGKAGRLGQIMGRTSQGLLPACCQHPAQAGPFCPSILAAPLSLCHGCRAGELSITAALIGTAPASLRATLAGFGLGHCRKPARLGRASLLLLINSLMTPTCGFAKSGQPQSHPAPGDTSPWGAA